MVMHGAIVVKSQIEIATEQSVATGVYRGGFPGVSGNPFGFYTLLETLRN